MSFAFMPIYTGDYLRDTRHLSMSEHGCYFMLLTFCWDTKGPLPLDERKIAALCNARSGDEVEAMRRVLAEFFVRMDDGHYNTRMQKEIERAESISRARSEAGKAGYQAKAKQLPSKSQAPASTPTPTLTPTPTTTNVKSTVAATASTAFKKPTLAEVTAYCAERGNAIDPQAWFDYYTANGWKVGRSPMKDWRAAVRTWERNGGRNGQQPAKFNPGAALRELVAERARQRDAEVIRPDASDLRAPLVLDIPGRRVHSGVDGDLEDGPF